MPFNSPRPGTLLVVGALASLLSAAASPAQPWANFSNETSTRLVAASSLGANDVQEKDYAWADVDQDGDTDLVCVRKQPFTTTGRFPNVLFMNENGVLTDRTLQLASHSSVAGSQGFLDDTNDRDVVLVDVDGDGWLDCVTCTTRTGNFAKYISHPRVYINRGEDSGGNWLGFTFDDESRIPTMPAEPRFCSIGFGDIDQDGDIDLYMGDYQQPESVQRAVDLNDRLFINDGTGYFADESSLRMSFLMLESSFAMASVVEDVNADGKLDILKDDALNTPQGVSVSYNDGASPGFFGTYQLAYSIAPYHINTGDLNNDGRPDIVVTDDGADRYVLNQGNNAQGVATWASYTFSFVGSGDDGFGGNNLIVDLNNDGWNDVVITDVDVDISGCGRRTHIYQNLANPPTVTLRETSTGGTVVGIPTSMLVGTHDAAIFDIDGDGWKDMVLGRCTGTQVWMNDPPEFLNISLLQPVPATIPPGAPYSFQVQITAAGGAVQVGTGEVFMSVNGTPFASAPMTSVGGDIFEATIPAANCEDQVRFYVQASTASQNFTSPANAPASWHETVAVSGYTFAVNEGFEGGAGAWTVQSSPTLTSGAWQVAVPNGTTSGGGLAAPSSAASGTQAFVTQNGAAGGTAGAADVDGGPTDLISPPMNLVGLDVEISYSRWFYSNGTDVLEVAISPDGNNWQIVETVAGAGENSWTTHTFDPTTYITVSATTQVRFRTSDNPNNSVTEAGLDDFRVQTVLCETCQTDIGYGGPGGSMLSLCGGDLSTGTTADLELTGGPANALVYLGITPTLTPTSIGSGTVITTAPQYLLPFPTDPSGGFLLAGISGGGGPLTIYAQALYLDPTLPGGVGISNGIEATWLP